MGVIIYDPQLGAEFMAGLDEGLPGRVWTVSLNDKNQLEWSEVNGDAGIKYTKEPLTSWWERFKAGFYRMLPIRSQL